MEKKFQFFISSTYEDLKLEREKAIYTILEMEQFPVGMELFSAGDEDQWEVISQTIDTSDYYILIIGTRYGSIVPEGQPDAGISYTEKEFNYALSKDVPVLAFIMDDQTTNEKPSCETPDIMAKLYAFKGRAKDGRYVKFFKNPEHLATLLSQSIHKALKRSNRPGWVRTTDFNIEESHARILQLTERIHTLEALNADLKLENNRKPELYITYRRDPESEDEDGKPIGNEPEIRDGVVHFKLKPVYVGDIKDGVTYKDGWGREVKVEANDIRILRHFFQNGFSLLFHVVNDGTARATGVRVHMDLPKDFLAASNQEIYEYMEPPRINCSNEEHEGRMKTLFPPDVNANEVLDEDLDNPTITLDELKMNEDIADLLDPGEMDVSAGEIELEFDEIKHKDSQFYKGAYFYPIKPGDYEINCSIMCNELADAVEQTIKVVVE